MRARSKLAILGFAAIAAILAGGAELSTEPQYTADFNIETGVNPADRPHYVPHGGNAYVSLEPGRFLRLEGEDDLQPMVVEITVLNRTRMIAFAKDGLIVEARTRVVEEREWVDGELSQVSLNYFACRAGTGNVFCFGEDVDHYEDGRVVSHEDSWLAGENGAEPGLYMPELFLLGSRYFQELAPAAAMDCAEHTGQALLIQTPAGLFRGCVEVLETTPLEPDEETLKVYAPGVGLIRDGQLMLTQFRP